MNGQACSECSMYGGHYGWCSRAFRFLSGWYR
jgi:hypothetical protein